MRELVLRRALVVRCVAVLLTTAWLLCCTSSSPSVSSSASDAGASAAGAAASATPAAAKSAPEAAAQVSIESEMLTYRSLEDVAGAIAAKVVGPGRADTGHVVLIATEDDASTFLEWRAAMGQVQLLQGIVSDVAGELDRLPKYSPPTPTPTPTPTRPPAPTPAKNAVGGRLNFGVGGGATGGGNAKTAETVVTGAAEAAGALLGNWQSAIGIVTGIAGMFAERQTQTSVPGTVRDLALMNAVAGKLLEAPADSRLQVYLPSSYAPGLYASSDLGDSWLLSDLASLGQDRRALQERIGVVADSLEKAAVVSKDAATPAAVKEEALGYLRSAEPVLRSATGAAASVDAFIAHLFGVAPEKPAAAEAGGEAEEEKTAKAGGKDASAAKAAKPAATPPPAIPLARLLRADLLAQRILGQAAGGTPPPPEKALAGGQLARWHVLVLKALESGGTVMVKDSFFRTAYSYSGGAVATFALFSLQDGRLESAGNSYAWDGFIREKDFWCRMNELRPVAGPGGTPPPECCEEKPQ